ncbi:MAG: cation acetate symporter [Methyloceanibacter sp.]
MSAPSRFRSPNPHLGAYYGIVTATLVSLVIVLAMFEQLGWSEASLTRTMMLVPLALYLFIAVGARTNHVEDFFASGRRVPPVYNGFVLAAIAVGGVGFLAYTGAAFFLGFDALAIGLGLTFGMLAAAILFVPYLRKAGSYTLPSFFGHRFRSRLLRAAASLVQLPPLALLLAAEIKIAAVIIALFLPLSYAVAVILVAILIAAIALLGGMRSITWSGSAEFLVGAVGLAAVVTVVSILLTNLPAPQLTYGELFENLQQAETETGAHPLSPDQAAPALPGPAPRPAVKPFLQPFGAQGPAAFLTLFLSLALGTAALPTLLARSGVTVTVAEQRRSSAWGVLFVAAFAMTVPAMAAFAKFAIFRDIAAAKASSLPAWLAALSEMQLVRAGDVNGDGAIGAVELLIGRDSIALALPSAAGLPYVLTALMATAALAIALAASASHLFTLAASLAEDLYRTFDRRQALPRIVAAWAAIAATALAAAVFLAIADLDPLKAALTGLAFAASSFFPALLLAIWWPRCTKWGAMAAMATGFLVMAGDAVFGGALGVFGAQSSVPLASLIGAVLALIAGIAASYIRAAPSQAEADYRLAMRNPDGESIYDRAQARAAAAAASAAARAEQDSVAEVAR